MSRRVWLFAATIAALVMVLLLGWTWLRGTGSGAVADDGDYTSEFSVDRSRLAATGRNPFFVLEPGYQLTYRGGNEELVITVLDQTEVVDGVVTRVVEERETRNGAVVEISRNFFAIDPGTGDVYYFGEDVDDYARGAVIGHSGAWRSGVAGARFGLMMPGSPQAGMKYYQEVAPGVALDRGEIRSTSDSVQVPAGSFDGVVSVVETTPLEPLVTGHKAYAPGIGMILDDRLTLVSHRSAR
jgi:hypothetical protein